MSQLRIRELSDAPFGADVEGLDPSAELGADDKALLQRAFDERGLLRFRNLDIDAHYQQYLAALVIGREGRALTAQSTTLPMSSSYPTGKRTRAHHSADCSTTAT